METVGDYLMLGLYVLLGIGLLVAVVATVTRNYNLPKKGHERKDR